jgi:hypothetical protein
MLSLLVLLCMTSGPGCDEQGSASNSPPSKAKDKNGRHAHASKKEKEKAEELRGKFKVGRLDHKLIPEGSGIIGSRTHPNVYWTHNDSGNAPVLFAVTQEGKLLGQYTVNVRNNDWEAISTDDEGHLYVGDIGNNERQRDRILVYRVDEPDPAAAPSGQLRVGAMWRLQYPDQPFDAESLFVYQGKGYVISKLLTGRHAGLYSFDLADHGDAQTLRHVCDLPIRSPVTDAAITPDGARLAVMTLTGPNVFQIDGDVAAAEKLTPKHVTYFDPKDPNMEGVCFAPQGLLATTEEGQMLLFSEKDFGE